ncbi:expressed unknown protein [Seminavis robusta]|uniref:Uncharacterized protein n=1 Tax=Seminavis robusta TaxID=568900 RepID=A0A9N8DPV1_9STRA|nr:expressed unknown protein [Seminavis robusta]|eukprot:Sro200_g084760.1 n/a (344) ;mRNA; r:50684-51715
MEGESNDDDEFWQVALCRDEAVARVGLAESESDDDVSSAAAPAITYNIPWRANASTTLKLSPLPDQNGIWSPLGAQAWHASSLLVAYLLQNTILRKDVSSQGSLLTKYLDWWFHSGDKQYGFTALELGSGAVGLVGIVLGLILGDCYQATRSLQQGDENISATIPRVILTDNEPNVLSNLQQNVVNTQAMLPNKTGRNLALLDVENLDWGDEFILPSSLQQSSGGLQLVVGSELVYTHATAKACAQVVLSILDHSPNVLVFILQVTDRDGWNNVFLPKLREKEHLQVISEEDGIHDSDLHELAMTLIPPGGTLDRFAYGGVFIFRRSGVVASLLELQERNELD